MPRLWVAQIFLSSATQNIRFNALQTLFPSSILAQELSLFFYFSSFLPNPQISTIVQLQSQGNYFCVSFYIPNSISSMHVVPFPDFKFCSWIYTTPFRLVFECIKSISSYFARKSLQLSQNDEVIWDASTVISSDGYVERNFTDQSEISENRAALAYCKPSDNESRGTEQNDHYQNADVR